MHVQLAQSGVMSRLGISIRGDPPKYSDADSAPGLWDQAFCGLADDDRKELESLKSDDNHMDPSEIARIAQRKRDECVKKQWNLYTNKAGDQVKVRDLLSSVVNWLNRFKEVCDAAVQFDPVHAALPWAVVRGLLMIAVSDVQTFGTMVEGVDRISALITRYAKLESTVLLRTCDLTSQLSSALVKLYGSVLKYLANTCRYYRKSTLKRALKSVVNSTKSMVDEPLLRIEHDEEEVFKLVQLVQNGLIGVKLDDILASIQESVKAVQVTAASMRTKLSAWLNGPESSGTYEALIQYHHPGTFQWALQLAQFRLWASTNESSPKVLWVHGPAGFGKTFMSAQMIKHLKKTMTQPPCYFFCLADNQLTRDPYQILRSWLTQMLDNDKALHILNGASESRSQSAKLSHVGLWELFVAVGSAIPGCTFVIDGFDECINIDIGAQYCDNIPRELFLRDLMIHLAKTKSRVLVVSRDTPDIRRFLGVESQSVASPGVLKLEYQITAKDTGEDVKSFSEHIINSKLFNRNADLRHKIAAQAAERSEGMFLWIKLLEQKLSGGQNAKQLAKTDEKKHAVMLLRWVMFAIRPLQVKQLAEALVVSGEEELDEYPEDDLPDCWQHGFVDESFVQDMILAPCGSLLQVKSASADTPLAEHTVHFVHFSVKEYLTSLAGHDKNQLGFDKPAVEEWRLASICLRYLTLEVFKDTDCDWEQYPFLSYAGWAWYFPSFQAKSSPPQDAIQKARRIFDPSTPSWGIWTPVMDSVLDFHSAADGLALRANLTATESRAGDVEPETYETVSESYYTEGEAEDEDTEGESHTMENHTLDSGDGNDDQEDELPKDSSPPGQVPSPVYYAALLGLEDMLSWLEGQGLDFAAPGGLFGFPLQAAVVGGSEKAVRHVLNSPGVQVSQRGGVCGTALIAAVATSRHKMAELLIQAGASTNDVDNIGETALHYVTTTRSVETARLLLDNMSEGQDIDSVNVEGRTALHCAVDNSCGEIVALLLERGANVNTNAASYGLTPLHTAIYNKDAAMVSRLLDSGADAAWKDEEGWTPLEAAAHTGNVDIVNLVIGAGAKVDGDEGILSDTSLTPLQRAIMGDHLDAAKCLWEHGADLNKKMRSGATALEVAVRSNRVGVLKWILEQGASFKFINTESLCSVFETAAQRRFVDVMHELVAGGVFQICPRGEPGTGRARATKWDDDHLVMLAYSGDADRVRYRLAEASGCTELTIGEALHAASAMGHLETVRALLNGRRRARINARDATGRTALHYAANRLHAAVVDLLVDAGADVSLEDDAGSTPIDLAVRHGTRALSIAQKHMDNHGLAIRRRPTVMAGAGGQSASAVRDIRRMLSGSWEGQYDYLTWRRGRTDPTSIEIPAKSAEGFAFSGDGSDVVGPFKYHGFVDPLGFVWWVKMYEELGWLYKGRLSGDGTVLKGTWGSNRKLWYGTFVLRKQS
ncbi:ankyrin repeat and SOCS box protein 7 [Pyricularia oryzae]|nr:ankyrin repeat and SOCS box protein 7 [Pyricularia oryzae]